MSRSGVIIASWDMYEMTKCEVEYRMQEWKDFGYEEEPDENQVWNDVSEDSDQHMFWWEEQMIFLNDALVKRSASGEWYAKGVNMGWQNLTKSISVRVLNAEKFIGTMLPRSGEYTFYVYEDGDFGLKVMVSHHDSPTGEWYYWTPFKKELAWFNNECVEVP